MSPREKLTVAVFTALLILYGTALMAIAATTGAAAAVPDHGAQTEDNDRHMRVNGTTDDGQLVVTVEYDGAGDAHLRIESDEEDYAGTGTYTVEDTRTVRLPYPTEPMALQVTATAENVRTNATVQFERTCGGIAPTSIHYEHTAGSGERTHSEERTVQLHGQGDCPESPEDDGAQQPEHDSADREEEFRDRAEERDDRQRDAPRHERPEKEPSPERPDDGSEKPEHPRKNGSSGPDAHETYNETHDQAIDTYDRGHDEAIGAYDRSYEKLLNAYERGHSAFWDGYERVQNGSDGGGPDIVPIVKDAANDAQNDSERVRNDAENDSERIQNDVERAVNKIGNDAENDSQRIQCDVMGCDGDDDGGSGTPTPPPLPEPPEPPEQPTPPEPPETPEPPEAPQTPEPPEAPQTPEQPKPPEVPETPETPEPPATPTPPGDGGGDDGGESIDASADADYDREGSNVSASGSASFRVVAGGYEVGASRSVSAESGGSTTAPAPSAVLGGDADPSELSDRLESALNER